MKRRLMMFCSSSLVSLILIGPAAIVGSSALGASASPALVKAKQEADAKGYIFVSSLGGHPKPANEGHFKTGQR